jgi:hypothetical protein
MLTNLWAAGFSFSRSAALINDTPYPPPRSLPHLFLGTADASEASLV